MRRAPPLAELLQAIFHLSSSAPPYKTQGKKVKALVTCCTMLIALTTVWLVGLVVSYADARLPPKFLKATNNVGKIYAGRFGYTVVPVAPKFLVQSVSRKEVHVPVLRPVRKKRRPLTGRRPGPPPLSEYGSYHDYPQSAASKNHPRLRKAPKFRRKPRPPPREPDYYEQEIEDEPEDFAEYDYEDKHHDKPLKGYQERPSKRGYSSSKPHEGSRPEGPVYKGDRHKTRFEGDDEFIAQHSEFYSSGYPPGKTKSRPPRFREHGDIEHHFGPPPGRKPKPSPKGYKGPLRPSSKLYSSSVAPPRRPSQYHKDEDRYRYEEEEEEEEVSPRPRYKKRPKVPEEEVYDETSRYKDSDKDVEQDKETGYSRPVAVHEDYHYNPDNFYHDRKFESKQKSKRGTEDKERAGGDRQRPRRPNDEVQRQFHPSEHKEEDHSEDERREEQRRQKEKPRTQHEETHQQQEHRASPAGKWSMPFSLEPEDEDVWDQGKPKSSERPPRKQPETTQDTHELPMPPRPKKIEEKPVSEYETAQSSWPVIVQGLNWKDAPHPFVDHRSPELFNNWQNFQIPQWPNLDEQLGKFPESLRSTFKWVEPTNQTPLHPTPSPPNQRTTTSLPPIAVPPLDYSRVIGSQTNTNQPRRKKSSKRSKNKGNDGTEVVAQRIVGGTLQLNGGFKQEPPKDEWANPAFLSASKTPGRSPQQQYTVEMFKSVEPGKSFDGDIVYGTRITDSKSKNIEPDIGYHSGMETVDDDIGGWQVY